MTEILIYGATGYTGTLLAEHAAAQGLRPVLAGATPTSSGRSPPGWGSAGAPRPSTIRAGCGRRSPGSAR